MILDATSKKKKYTIKYKMKVDSDNYNGLVLIQYLNKVLKHGYHTIQSVC